MDFTWCVDVLHTYFCRSLGLKVLYTVTVGPCSRWVSTCVAFKLPTSEMFCTPRVFEGLLDLMCQTFEFLHGRISGAERILRRSRGSRDLPLPTPLCSHTYEYHMPLKTMEAMQ